MKSKTSGNAGKIIAITFLYITAAIICTAGLSFTIMSFQNGIFLTILAHRLPGYVFGIVVLFLGARYMISVYRLCEELFRTNCTFSFRNFLMKTKDAG